jgi:hypothetical protein
MIVAKGINVEWILWKSDDSSYDEKFGWRSSSGSNIYSTTTAQNNTWYHLLATVGAAGQRLYVNGVLEASNATTSVPSGSLEICIGAGLSGGNPANFLLGNISSMKIWNRQLSATEVMTDYLTTKTRFFTRELPVSTSLILSLDAGNISSYKGSGTTWTDLSGYGNNATLTNGPTFRGVNGGAIVFDGVNDYALLSDVPFRFANANFTLEVVFYYGGGSVNYPLLAKRSNSNPFLQYNLAIFSGLPYVGGNGNVLTCFCRTDNSTDRTVTYTLDTPGVYHAVVTSSQSVLTLYVNSVSRSTSTTSLEVGAAYSATGEALKIGENNTGSFFNGRIHLVRVYNKTLSSTEVLQNYNATKSRFVI